MVARAKPLRLPLAFLAALALLSCQGEAPLVPSRDDPYLYVPIGQRSYEGEQRALLLNIGAPKNATERVAQQFDITRTRDGAVFRWLHDPFPYPTFCDIGCPLSFANYVLPDTATPTSHGANEIAAGDTLILNIVTGSVTISGTTVVPPPPQPTVVVRGSSRVIVWPRVTDVVRYVVDNPFGQVPFFQSDTEFVVPARSLLDSAGIYSFTVKALDANMAAITASKTAARAGIDKGLGVFGAVSQATVLVAVP